MAEASSERQRWRPKRGRARVGAVPHEMRFWVLLLLGGKKLRTRPFVPDDNPLQKFVNLFRIGGRHRKPSASKQIGRASSSDGSSNERTYGAE